MAPPGNPSPPDIRRILAARETERCLVTAVRNTCRSADLFDNAQRAFQAALGPAVCRPCEFRRSSDRLMCFAHFSSGQACQAALDAHRFLRVPFHAGGRPATMDVNVTWKLPKAQADAILADTAYCAVLHDVPDADAMPLATVHAALARAHGPLYSLYRHEASSLVFARFCSPDDARKAAAPPGWIVVAGRRMRLRRKEDFGAPPPPQPQPPQPSSSSLPSSSSSSSRPPSSSSSSPPGLLAPAVAAPGTYAGVADYACICCYRNEPMNHCIAADNAGHPGLCSACCEEFYGRGGGADEGRAAPCGFGCRGARQLVVLSRDAAEAWAVGWQVGVAAQ